MHYCSEIWLKDLGDVEAQIAAALEKHREDFSDGECSGFWDWYQIGGRYTGNKVTNYDPSTDPRNVETCMQCGGTGLRSDKLGRSARAKDPTYTCNGCGTFQDGKWSHGPFGPGRALKWPTNWAPFAGDILPVSATPADTKAYTLIVGDQVFHREVFNGKDFVGTDYDGEVMKKLSQLGITDGFLVTVDYHHS